jgi:TPR repeat protein
MYHKGKGVDQNNKEAVKWLRKAAEQGDAVCQKSLGILYLNG